MRICCLNNYSLDRMIGLAERGETPGQHGWGVPFLRRTFGDVLIAPYCAPADRALLDRLSIVSRHLLGQLDQQLWAARLSPDVLYSADQLSLAGLALARKAVARRARMISVVHHPVHSRRGRLRLAALRAHDVVAVLSPALCQELVESGVRARFIPWGPDLSSPLYEGQHDEGYAVSTGKSNRDLAVLVRAMADTGYPGRVLDVRGLVSDAPANVTIVRVDGDRVDPAGDILLATRVLDLTRAAGFVAIPIANPDRLTGLTEINDALALAKPIVITRSPYTPIDVEAIGCGVVVEPGDEDGWSAAIEMMRDPTVRRDMGTRGRRFAEQSWNYELFGADLVDLIAKLVP